MGKKRSLGRMSKKRSLGKYLVVLAIVAVAGLSGVYFWYAEGEMPVVRGLPEGSKISPDTVIQLQVTDAKSGLRFVRVTAAQEKQEQVLIEESFSQPKQSWERELTLAQADLSEGLVRLQVEAKDQSWSNWLQGNTRTEEASYEFDSQPPRISMESFEHNVRQGGAGVAAFRVSEPVSRAGVQIDDFFFPAYAQSEDLYLCFFSFPFSLRPQEGQLQVKAVDQAGNVSRAGFHHYINPGGFDQSHLQITEGFLQNVIVNFQEDFPNQDSLLDVFLAVNREMRKENRSELRKIGLQTDTAPLWSGRFLRQPNASREAHFGTHRKYVYQGQVIDEQTHLGIDLASIARAEVPAANSGKVVFADWMGIYGQVVILDHGLGLQSLYAHLSQMSVHKGDAVDKGQIIGRTGATGLAGGDHLHFGMLVSGVPVNPVEWWDGSWITNNVTSKLSLIDE